MQEITKVLIQVDLLIMDVETALALDRERQIPLAKAKLAHQAVEYVLAWLELLEIEKEAKCLSQ